MKKIRTIISFQKDIYLKGSQYIVPGIFTLMFLKVLYMAKPVHYMGNVQVSTSMLFIMMVWIGYAYHNHEDSVSRQINILRMKNYKMYELSDSCFICMVGLCFGVITAIFPIMEGLLNGFGMFTDGMDVMKIIGGLLIQIGSAWLGGALGMLFHPCVFRERHMSLAVCIMITMITIAKPEIIRAFSVGRYLMYFFPPVYESAWIYSQNWGNVLLRGLTGFLVMMIYAVILTGIRLQLLKKRDIM